MASRRLTIRLAEDLQEQLQVLVRRTGRTESDLVREALAAYCAREGAIPSCYEVAQEAGFLGALEGGPDDLSANPSYMEGFGCD